MEFDLNKSLEILERTPRVLYTMLSGLSDDWVFNNEGSDTWSPFDVLGHLIHGERTDWITRTKIILESGGSFEPFDRFAQLKESEGKNLDDLLEEFKLLRHKNLEELKAMYDLEGSLDKTGIHPEFGEVTLRQLLSCWTAHDLGHIYQISRVMAKNYKSQVGPWIKYLRVLND